MHIEALHLKSFRCFKELDIQFPESNLAVFIGLNGSGKTAILDAINSLLSQWDETGFLVSRGIKVPNLYTDGDITIDSAFLINEIKLKFENQTYTWSHFKVRSKPYKVKCNKVANEFTELGKINLIKKCSILQYNAVREKINYNRKTNRGLYKLESFKDFKDWFVEESNKENRTIIEKRDFNISNDNLNVIRNAIEIFFSNISNISISKLQVKDTNNKKTDLILNCNHLELSFSQLSEGQKNLLLLVSDIAFSLIDGQQSNFSSSKVLKRTGIVLIDEIELHLHPQWQREVLPALQKTFPNIQFIVTTHSPQVLSRVHKDDIFILKDNQIYQPSSNPIGRDSSDILDEIMDITKRPDDIQKLSDDYFLLLAKNELEAAAKIRAELDKLVEDKKLDKDDPLFYRANGILARKQLLKK